jgi:hypothetical protein
MLKICIIITVIFLNKTLAVDLPKEELKKPSWNQRVFVEPPPNTSVDLMENYDNFTAYMQELTTFAINRDEKDEILGIISKVPCKNWEIFSEYALSISKMTDYNFIKIKLIKMLTIVKPDYYALLLNNLEKLNPKYHKPLIDNLIKAKPEGYPLLLEEIDGWSRDQSEIHKCV